MGQSSHGEQASPVFLRSSLLVIQYRRKHYLLFHPGSSSLIATDWLGARAARLLIRGHSDAEVARLLERWAPGAGQRFRRIRIRLETIGATVNDAPAKKLRWHVRVGGSLALGWLLSGASALLRWLPLRALQWLYEVLPETPFGKRTIGQSFAWMDGNLRFSGFAVDSPQRRGTIARASGAASTRLFFFLYLCGVLPPERFTRFLRYVIDAVGFEEMWGHVAQSGAVVAGIHSDLYFGVPIYLRTRGMAVSCVADVFGLGVKLASNEDIGRSFPLLFPDMIDSRGAMAGKELLARLREGGVVTSAFDAPPQRETLGETMPTIAFLGHTVRRFDGAAWLAVRSGKPLIFVGTYRRGKRTILQVTRVQPDMTLSVRERVAALTAQLYALGEAFIREHPESWMVWSYFHTFGALRRGETGVQGAVTDAVAGFVTPEAAANDVGR
ncbi:MAG: LpxL/LpxP family acyltransferase [Ktedonobacterales bacterium]